MEKWQMVKASSFADDADVARFRAAKSLGKTDQQAFKVGDNGVGCWGHETNATKVACVALPPDDIIARFGSIAGGKDAIVLVRRGGTSIVARLRDRMPWRKNIKNGCGIDLNPAACKALGLRPPMLAQVEWKWPSEGDRL